MLGRVELRCGFGMGGDDDGPTMTPELAPKRNDFESGAISPSTDMGAHELLWGQFGRAFLNDSLRWTILADRIIRI